MNRLRFYIGKAPSEMENGELSKLILTERERVSKGLLEFKEQLLHSTPNRRSNAARKPKTAGPKRNEAMSDKELLKELKKLGISPAEFAQFAQMSGGKK